MTYGNDNPQVGLGNLEIIAVDKFLSMIDISEDIQTAILTLKINASEPELAAEINNVLIEELDRHQHEYNKTKARETKQFIEERIIDTEKELMSAEESLKIFTFRTHQFSVNPKGENF